MGLYKNWVCFVRTKLSKSQTAHRRIVDKSINDNRSADEGEDNEDCHELIAATKETNVNDDDDDDDDDDDINASPSWIEKEYSAEDIAAIKIQAFYRGVLARRAFRALRSIVKLQALVRGVQVRRQSRIALHCMHVLARLQVSVRTRQLLRN